LFEFVKPTKDAKEIKRFGGLTREVPSPLTLLIPNSRSQITVPNYFFVEEFGK
jgi:hypothetical protein